MDFMIISLFAGSVYDLFMMHNILVLKFEPSLTFRDPLIGHEMDPARQIIGDPWKPMALQGPLKVDIDIVFYLDKGKS